MTSNDTIAPHGGTRTSSPGAEAEVAQEADTTPRSR
jgi:hypothetical protein